LAPPVDGKQGRFSGSGVSSSIYLALDLMIDLTNIDIVHAADLSIQYAPNPPVCTGDPA